MSGEFRVRVSYRKVGRLRWLSHLEVIHALERGVRRAGLPYAITNGFSPHMRIAFGHALPVGTAGQNEYVDLWLTRYTVAEEVVSALGSALPYDLGPESAMYPRSDAPSLTAALTIGQYSVEIIGEEKLGPESVQGALDALLRDGELTVTNKGKNKVFALARSIPKEPRVECEGGSSVVRLDIRMGPEGSLRPEVFVRSALQRADVEVSALRTTRHDCFIEDDRGGWSRPV